MQNLAPGDRSLGPPQTTAAEMQNRNEGDQNTSNQGDPKPKWEDRFSCKNCSYSCNNLEILKLHCRSVHSKKSRRAQNLAPSDQSLGPSQTADAEMQKMKALRKAGGKRWRPNSKSGKKKGRQNLQSGNQKGRPAPNFQSGQQKARPAPNIQSGSVPGNSGRSITKLKDYISRADREPLIGLEYVLEYRLKIKGNQIETKYFCELCECEADVDPMVEHLAGFRHRKLYLAKVYPYVLRAQANSKEDPSQFIRRMALEIEREEGTKKYMVDDSIWMETMMTLRTADKKIIERKTRWNDDKNGPTRVKKALNYLGIFEIESEIEATTVTRLCEKLMSQMKVYSNKPKQDALFPARVARAQDVVKSLLQNAAQQRACVQNPIQKTEKPQIPPQFNKRPPIRPENANLRHTAGVQGGHPGANYKNMNARQNMPMTPPYKQAQKYPSGPLYNRQERPEPSMPQMKEAPQKADSSFLKNISQEDTQFFKKLMSLLEVLPQSASPPETTEDRSKLQVLKSLLVKEKNAEHEQANNKMMMQIASIMQDTISAQNASLNQQLMLMTSQNSTAMVMQTASMGNNLMATGGFVPGNHSLGAVQTNMNSLMPFNRSFGSQTYGQKEGNASRPTNQNAHRAPPQNYSGPPQNYSGPPQNYSGPPQNYSGPPQNYSGPPQNYSGPPQNYNGPPQNYNGPPQNYNGPPQNYNGPPQNYGNYGYRNSMAGNYVPQGNPNASQHDGIDNSLTTRQNEQKRIPHTAVDYESSASGKEWDKTHFGNSSTQASETRYADHSEEDAAYTRVRVSPSSRRNQYHSNDDTRGEIRTEDQRRRAGVRSYSAAGWDEQEEDIRYNKRPRLDMDNRSDRSEESDRNQSLEALGINTADIPEELLKKIQGKDLFTASAIISEYTERRIRK